MAGRAKGVVVQISAEDNTARAFESVNAQVTRLREQVASLRTQLAAGGPGEALAQGMGHAVPQIAAASGALRELEGTMPIRAAERFLSTTLGLGQALSAAFPVVGAIAFFGVIVDGALKVDEFIKKMREMPRMIENAYRDARLSSQLANDEAKRDNDLLQNRINKLEHKPENALVIAMDDARIAADKLTDSMAKGEEQSKDLLSHAHAGITDRVFHSDASTASVEGSVKSFREKLSDVSGGFDAAAHSDDKDATDRARTALADAQNKYAKWLDDQIRMRTGNVSVFEGPDPDANRLRTDGRMVPFSQKYGSQQGNIRILRGEQSLLSNQISGEAQDDRKATLDPDYAADEAAATAAEAAHKLEEARARVNEAARKAAEQSEQAAAEAAKRSSDLALAQLDDQHKRALISDRDYYAQKLQLQVSALDAEVMASRAKEGDIATQLRQTIAQRGRDLKDPARTADDNAKIIELQTQINVLEQQRLDLEEKIQKLKVEGNTSDTGALQKQVEAAQKLASQVEAIRGGTAARLAESDTDYRRKRKEMVAQGASAGEIGDFDTLHTIGDAQIGAKDAEQSSGAAVAAINSQRAAASDQAARGYITSIAAQQKKIALDAQEAAALQPLLEYQKQLAAAGDVAASEKVEELSRRIAELKDPVNEVAAEIRNQFDTAFESLFENLDKGQKAWKDFARSIQSDLLKDAYKQFVEPAAQAALGALVPNKAGIPGVPKSGVTAASALGGILPKAIGAIPGIGKGAGAGSGAPVVNIINQSSTPVQGTATSSGGDITDALRAPVIQIVLEDLDRGGAIGQALSGGLGLLA